MSERFSAIAGLIGAMRGIVRHSELTVFSDIRLAAVPVAINDWYSELWLAGYSGWCN